MMAVFMAPITGDNELYNNKHNGTILAIFYYHLTVNSLILPKILFIKKLYYHENNNKDFVPDGPHFCRVGGSFPGTG